MGMQEEQEEAILPTLNVMMEKMLILLSRVGWTLRAALWGVTPDPSSYLHLPTTLGTILSSWGSVAQT